MPPLTTITILVYELVKVNRTTRALPVLRLDDATSACLQKNREAALTDKKNEANNCATKTGAADSTRTALPNRFAKWKHQQT